MVKHFRGLRVYRGAFVAAMRIFECSNIDYDYGCDNDTDNDNE